MGIDKAFYHNVVRNMFSDPCEVKYWDGEVKRYGEGEAQFRLNFKDPIAKVEIVSDPSLAFGEGYMLTKLTLMELYKKLSNLSIRTRIASSMRKKLMLN